jgi:hypothetical protein
MQNNGNSIFQPEETEITPQNKPGPKPNPDLADRDWRISEMIKGLKAEGYTNEISIMLVRLDIDYQIMKSKFIRSEYSSEDAHKLAIEEIKKDLPTPYLSESSIKSVYQDYVGPKKDRIQNSINSDLDSAVNQSDVDQAIEIYTEVYGQNPIKSRKPRNR